MLHFGVPERSDVRLRLGGSSPYALVLLTDSGSRISTSGSQIRRELDRGRYVVAVRAEIGAPASAYTLGLVIRRITTTTLKASTVEPALGTSVTFTLARGGSAAAGLERSLTGRSGMGEGALCGGSPLRGQSSTPAPARRPTTATVANS